jgi:hypothetical protein
MYWGKKSSPATSLFVLILRLNGVPTSREEKTERRGIEFEFEYEYEYETIIPGVLRT